MAKGIIEDFRLTRVVFPRNRITGDSQVRTLRNWIGILELTLDTGEVGLGFIAASFKPLPDLAELVRVFGDEIFPKLKGQAPFPLTQRLSRPRGGNQGSSPLGFGNAVDQAAWDLLGKQMGMPLHRMLGGTVDRVEAYASDLGYHLTHDEVAELMGEARAQGFKRFKVKVGHPELAWDLTRLEAVQGAVGKDAVLMVDSNEAWSPKEAIRRLHAYKDAGFTPYWVEDPCLRDDFVGLREIRDACPFTLVNSGEYLDLHGKRQLLEARGADILNIHGRIGDAQRAIWLAGDHGLQISLGNTAFNFGAAIAAAVPGGAWVEQSFHNTTHLLRNPIRFQASQAILPTEPGLGLVLDEAAVAAWRRDTAAEDPVVTDDPPPGPVVLKGYRRREHWAAPDKEGG